MTSSKQLPTRHDLEAVAGNPFTFTVTTTGATITSPAVTIKNGSKTTVTADPSIPTVSQASTVTTVAFAAGDTTALGASSKKTYTYSLQALVNGAGPYELVAGVLTVSPVGTAGTSSTSTAALTVTVGAAALSLTVAVGGAGLTLLSTSNGTDDTSMINTALALGGRVIGVPGETYEITTLVIPSNTELDMTGCTVHQIAGQVGNMIRNTATTAARTVVDGAITAASTTLTSATATFVAGDVGSTVWVWGAGIGGEILKTTIASRTNSTTVELALAASTTVTGYPASVGTRDSNITIRGGKWDRGNNHETATNLSGLSFLFRRAENVTICDLRGESTNGWYFVSIADCTDWTVERLTFQSASDGVHITGPAKRGCIRTIRGYTDDDTVSLTATDWPGKDDVYGPISHIFIDDIRPRYTSNTAVKVIGGSNSIPATSAQHIWINGVSGYTDNADQSKGGLIWIGDDGGIPITDGGYVNDINISNVAGVVPSSGAGKNNVVYINSANCGRINVERVQVNVSASVTTHAVYVGGLASIAHLTVVDCDIRSASTDSSILYLEAGGVQSADVRGCTINDAGGSAIVELFGASAFVYRLQMSNCDHRNGYAFVKAPTAGQRVDALTMTNMRAGTVYFVAHLNCTTELNMACVGGGFNNSSLNLGASASVTVRADACNLNGRGVATAGGYALASKGLGFAVDVASITTASAGDLCYNTNAARACGVGPLAYNGTTSKWVNLATAAVYP